jgi:hypothetical protein
MKLYFEEEFKTKLIRCLHIACNVLVRPNLSVLDFGFRQFINIEELVVVFSQDLHHLGFKSFILFK